MSMNWGKLGGSVAVTSHDVAKLAGVSQPTVSRALSNHPRVLPETRDRVLKAAKQLGYVPHYSARSLSTLSTKRIGVLTSDLDNPFYPSLISPLHQTFSQHGYQTVLLPGDYQNTDELETLVDGSLDGVVITNSRIDSDLPVQLVERGIPTILVNRTIRKSVIDSVTADDEGGGKLIAQLFLELGHKNIGCLFGTAKISTGKNGANGFMNQMSRSKVMIPQINQLSGEFTPQFGHDGLIKLMRLPQPPTAIYCANDVIAVGALNACAELGIKLPADLTIVGLDDIDMAAWPSFNLTTVHTDISKLASIAANRLIERIQNLDLKPLHHVEPVTMTLRGTHGKPRVRNTIAQ